MEKEGVIKKAIDTLKHLFLPLSFILQVIAILFPSGTTIMVVIIMPSSGPFIIGVIAVIIWIILFFATIYALGWYNLTKHAKEIKRSLESLLTELIDNKNLADKGQKKGYDTSAYKAVKEAKYWHVLPTELREKINEAQIMLLNAQLRDKPHLYYVDLIDTERLKELYEDIIPDFEEYLKKKYGR